jgi:hypothetical protein
VSLDGYGHWALWDTASKALIASGNSFFPGNFSGPGSTPDCPTGCPDLEMAGDVFAIAQTNAIELRSATDGHLIVSIPADPPAMFPAMSQATFGLASDGSYVWVGSHADLEAWSASGVKLFSHPGNYFGDTAAFATPSQIQIGHVGSTVQTIEYVAVPSGTSTVSAAFAGTFYTWFQDDASFLTSSSGTTVRVYTKDVVQQAISALPKAFTSLGGYGNYFWTYTSGLGYPLSVYAIAQPSTPVQTLNAGLSAPVGSAGLVAVFNSHQPVLTLLHLDPGGVTKEDVPTPSGYLGAFGADASGAWSVGDVTNGVLYDRDNLLAMKGPLSCGRAFDYDGAQTGLAAVATPGGGVLTFTAGATGLASSGVIPYDAQRVRMSADGSVIAVQDNQTMEDDLRVFTMPGAVQVKDWSFPVSSPYSVLLWLSLARGGTAIGQVWTGSSPVQTPLYEAVTDITGTTTSFMNQGLSNVSPLTPRIFVSPNGTVVAVSDPTGQTAQIYKNGALADVATGEPYGWLDDDRLLLQLPGNMTAVHSVMATTNVTTVSVPCTSFTPVDTNHVFCWAGYQSGNNNAIYDVATSAIVWTGSPRSIPGGLTGLGAAITATNDAKTATLAGGYVVYGNGSQILVEPYTIPP